MKLLNQYTCFHLKDYRHNYRSLEDPLVQESILSIFNFCRIQLQNKGTVRMDYNWQVVMEEFMQASRSVTFAAETVAGSRAGSITPSVVGDITLHMPFSVEPAFGSILPGKKADIKVRTGSNVLKH